MTIFSRSQLCQVYPCFPWQCSIFFYNRWRATSYDDVFPIVECKDFKRLPYGPVLVFVHTLLLKKSHSLLASSTASTIPAIRFKSTDYTLKVYQRIVQTYNTLYRSVSSILCWHFSHIFVSCLTSVTTIHLVLWLFTHIPSLQRETLFFLVYW